MNYLQEVNISWNILQAQLIVLDGQERLISNYTGASVQNNKVILLPIGNDTVKSIVYEKFSIYHINSEATFGWIMNMLVRRAKTIFFLCFNILWLLIYKVYIICICWTNMLTYFKVKQKYNHFAASHVIIRVVLFLFNHALWGLGQIV